MKPLTPIDVVTFEALAVYAEMVRTIRDLERLEHPTPDPVTVRRDQVQPS